MNFTPHSEKDLPRTLLEKGSYHVEVLEAVDAISKTSKSEMIKLTVAVWVGDKLRCRLFDYLLESTAAKLRHACDTFGLLSRYEAGTIQAGDFIGRSGTAKIGIQQDKTGQYPDKNVIQDYVCRPAKALTGASVDAPPHNDDDLPF
jgi:hypothetical protein